jgi:hypothetical protein
MGTAAVVLVVLMLAFVAPGWHGGSTRDVQPADVLRPGEEPTPLRIGQLEPGTYAATDWTPSFVLTPSDDTWRVVELDRDWLSLVRGPDSLQIARWDSVVDPSAPAWGPDNLVGPPADLAAWLTDHPRLRTTSEATSLAGVPAVRITARSLGTLDRGPPECAGQPCVTLARAGSSSAFMVLTGGQIATMYVVGDVGHQFVIFYAAPRDRFEALEDASELLLQSVRFGSH